MKTTLALVLCGLAMFHSTGITLAQTRVLPSAGG